MQKKYDGKKKQTVYDSVNITVGMLNVVIAAGILLILVLLVSEIL